GMIPPNIVETLPRATFVSNQPNPHRTESKAYTGIVATPTRMENEEGAQELDVAKHATPQGCRSKTANKTAAEEGDR
ncbi:hypothetical protein KEM48_005830, partial [Puccinia striiformis f. sp. tritici PST-130]